MTYKTIIDIAMQRGKRFGIIISLFWLVVSCNNPASFTVKQSAATQDSARHMMELIARDITHQGPVAWLRYFENTPGFFMASDGQLVFPDNISATNFINKTLVKSIHTIDLHWSNIRIDPFSKTLANVAANFNEDITDFSEKKVSVNGYFTGTAEQTSQGWELRNLHWSINTPK